MILSSSAIVLKRFPYSETSIIARCFTRELGKMGFIIHGAYRKKSPLAGYFQPMNYLDLVFYNKQTRELQTVSKVAFKKPWPGMTDDLKKIAYGLALVELTDRCLSDLDAHHNLFDALVNALEKVAAGGKHMNLVFWRYQYYLLTFLGFRPDFTQQEVDLVPLPDPFSGPNSKAIFESFQRGNSGLENGLSITAADRKAVSEYLNTHLQAHFEGTQNLKSLRILKEMLI